MSTTHVWLALWLADLPLGWRIYAAVALSTALAVIVFSVLAVLPGIAREAIWFVRDLIAIVKGWLPRRPPLYVVRARRHSQRRLAQTDDAHRRRQLDALRLAASDKRRVN